MFTRTLLAATMLLAPFLVLAGGTTADPLPGTITITVGPEVTLVDWTAGLTCTATIGEEDNTTAVAVDCDLIPPHSPVCARVGVTVDTTGGPGVAQGTAACVGLAASCTVATTTEDEGHCSDTDAGAGFRPFACRSLVAGGFSSTTVTCTVTP